MQIKTLEYKPHEVKLIPNILEATHEQLLEELNKRKKVIIAEATERINKDIALLKSLGILIEDYDDPDYIMEKITTDGNKIEYHIKERF